MSTALRTFDGQCGAAILFVIQSMISDKEMPWARKQILNSDEAANDVIARLPHEFNRIDANHFRRIVDSMEKRSDFPRFTEQNFRAVEDVLSDKFNRWDETREHEHSEEYERLMASEEYRQKCSEWKDKFDCVCVACGMIQVPSRLEIHHYRYDRMFEMLDEDVCCVCSPAITKRPCHPLLDFARTQIRNMKNDGLFQ